MTRNVISDNTRSQVRKTTALLLQYLVAIFVCLVVLVPIMILLIASFKANKEFLKMPLFQLPQTWTLENYAKVLKQGNFITGFKNTIIIIVVTCGLNIFLSSMQAYALGRFDFRGRKTILGLIMGARVIPQVTTQVATFTIISALGLFNTRLSAILLYMGTDVVQTMLYIQYVKRIHVSLDESALIDGASYFRIFFSIIFPLLQPATVTVVILKVIACYNDMYIPYLYMPSKKLQVVSTAIMKFCSSNYGSIYPVLAAVFMVVMLPVLVLYIAAQKQLFAGITNGAVKE